MNEIDIKKQLSNLLKDSMDGETLNDDGYFNDDACFSGNAQIFFKDLLKMYKAFGCVGITFEPNRIFINLDMTRGCFDLWSADEVYISSRTISLWFD